MVEILKDFSFDLQIFAENRIWVSGTTLTLGAEVQSMSEGMEFSLRDGSGNEYATLKRVDEDDYGKYWLTLNSDSIVNLKNIDLQEAETDNVAVLLSDDGSSDEAKDALSKVVFTLSGGRCLKGAEHGSNLGITLGTPLNGVYEDNLTLLHGDFRMGRNDYHRTIKIETTDAVTLAWKTYDSSEPNCQFQVEALGGGSTAKATYYEGSFTQTIENAKITVEKALGTEDFIKEVGNINVVFSAYEGAVIKGDSSGNAIPCGGRFKRSGAVTLNQVILVEATEADVVFEGQVEQWKGSEWSTSVVERVTFQKGAEGTIENLSERNGSPLEITLKKGSISTGEAGTEADPTDPSDTSDNTIQITLANGGVILAEQGDGFDVTSEGLVSGMDTGEIISIGKETYTAAADGTKIQYLTKNLGSLQAGAVALEAGGSIYVGGADYKVTFVEGEEGCTVDADGSITGLAVGNRLALEQDGEKYDCLVSEGELSVTKDGVTKSCPLNDEGSIAEDALETAMDEVLEELYPPDPSKPQTIKTIPGKTKTPETYNPEKDTIRISKASGVLDADKLILTEDGQLTYGDSFAEGLADNGAVDLSEAEKGKRYYTARLTDKDGNHKQLAAWSGTEAATVDMSGETRGVVMKDGGNGKQDEFLGGSGRDSIAVGEDDIAIGGEGNDVLDFSGRASGAEVGIRDGDGHDVVKGFRFGFDSDSNAVRLLSGQDMAGLNVDSHGRLKTGENTTLEFSGKNLKETAETDLKLSDGWQTYDMALGTNMKAVNGETADIYLGTGKEAEVDFSRANESELLLDLGNTGNYGKNAASFYHIKKAIGAKGASNSIVGGDSQNNILQGGDDGENRLYGGRGGNDTLIGSSTSEDMFYFGADSGKDVIQNYSEEDVLVFLGGSLDHVTMEENGHLRMYWQDGAGNTSRLTFDENMRDMVVTYEAGGERHGAKFGSKLTMDDDTADFVNYYNGGSSSGNGELDITGDDSKKIWLDGSHGVIYDGISKVDASRATGDLELAGSARNDSLLAGQGNTSLWGGAGSDTLTGGNSSDMFILMQGDGSDKFTDFTAGTDEDSDMLNIWDGSYKSLAMTDSGQMTLKLQDGTRAVVTGTGLDANSKMQLKLSADQAAVIVKAGYASQKNKFSYDEEVDFYLGGSGTDTVRVGSTDDAVNIWLDGSNHSAYYASIDVVDASEAKGNAVIAGDSSKQTIVGGRGNNSLWGGAGGNDTLKGGTANTFYWGITAVNEGNDVVTDIKDGDTIYTNLSLSQLMGDNNFGLTEKSLTLTTTEGNTLKVDGLDKKTITLVTADGIFRANGGNWSVAE